MNNSGNLTLVVRRAGVSRRQVQGFHQNFIFLEFHDHIWNHHEKYIQKSTNMSGIGSLIREIDVRNSEI